MSSGDRLELCFPRLWLSSHSLTPDISPLQQPTHQDFASLVTGPVPGPGAFGDIRPSALLCCSPLRRIITVEWVARLSPVLLLPARCKAASDINTVDGARRVVNAFISAATHTAPSSAESRGDGKQRAHVVFELGSVATFAVDTESTQILPQPLGSLLGLADLVAIVSRDIITSFPLHLPHLPISLHPQTHVTRRFFAI